MNNHKDTQAFFSARTRANPLPKRNESKVRSIRSKINRSMAYRGVIVCLAIVLGLAAVRNIDLRLAKETSAGAETEVGRLKFVGSDASSDALGVSAEAYHEPLEGEVVQTFSGGDVKIAGEESAEVCSILSGSVVATSLDSVTVSNSNGTKTTYNGIAPRVSVGQKVEGAQVIGTLSGEVLSVETLSGIGYLDSLDGDEIASYSMKDIE